MGIISVVLFFIYFWGFGFALIKLLRVKEGNFLERQLMRTGIGMSVISILAILMSLAGVPLDWRIFLALAVAFPLVHLARNYKSYKSSGFQIRLKKSDLNVFLLLLIVAGSLQMYASGAFAYPYLEDDDSWAHAGGVKYVTEEKTFRESPYKSFQYVNPYPPAYEFILALMHQTEPSLQWTMKFFNALIVSLSLVYFYFFAKEFTGKRNKALFATFVLAAVPAYQSHFIWASALAMTLFFPAMYALEMIKHDRKWKWVAGVAIAGILVSQPTHPFILFPMILAYMFVKFLAEKNLKAYATAALSGIVISLSWWGFKGKAFIRGNSVQSSGQAEVVAESSGFFGKIISKLPEAFAKNSGTETRPYTFNDFFIAQGTNYITNPVGFGIAVTILAFMGGAAMVHKIIISAKSKAPVNSKNANMIIVLLWFAFTFLVVNTMTFNLPVGFFGFRVWMIMAVPFALIATEGMWLFYAAMGKKSVHNAIEKIIHLFGRFYGRPGLELPRERMEIAGKLLLSVLVIVLITLTSTYQKYEVNTSNWPWGVTWTSPDEIQAYVWLKNLPHDTKVFSFITDDFIVGFDKFSCGWCEAEATYRKEGFNDSPEGTAEWMKNNQYEYVVLGGMEAVKYGENQTLQKVEDFAGSGLFKIAHQTRGAFIFKVV